MDPELKSIISHLAKLKKAMAESEQQPEEATPSNYKKKSKAKKPNPVADVDPKKNWYDWYKALEPRLKTSWQKSVIYDVLALCTSGDFPCDCSLIIAGLCFWSSSVNCMRLHCGMMTPALLDLAAIVGLRPHGVVYSAADLPEPLLKPDYDKPNKNFTNWIKTHFGYIGSSFGAPIGSTNGVSYMKHIAFLQIQVTKEVQPLAEALADGQAVALVVLPKPMSCNPLGPIWLFQLWPQVYFPELGLANVTFRGDSLLGKSIASLPLPKHHVEDCFRFFYGCSQRSPSDLSMCLDHRYPGYLALDLASIPTLETKEER
ncbi:hypothetical protein PRUPE_6G164100 [Prunus persica]|uniref:Aminotransferase-like plant mobile domain-containing protein n=1 Tax=Prunus persica TaxID=3760 RepID=M5XLM5_PRUPE|nr:hypothetical protein PRUPE_6G164100 [Prunus persica]